MNEGVVDDKARPWSRYSSGERGRRSAAGVLRTDRCLMMRRVVVKRWRREQVRSQSIDLLRPRERLGRAWGMSMAVGKALGYRQ